MRQSFLQQYLNTFHTIEGWFSYDAALLFMAYNQVAEKHAIAGDVLEIGVHHGLSTIAAGKLCGATGKLVAVDLFESLQAENISSSGSGDRRTFERNMRQFYPDLSFLKIFACASDRLNPNDLGSNFSFCHIDGGHSPQETYNDLRLCHRLLVDGGLLALDDYYNPEHPGVCEGAVQFYLDHRAALRPLVVAYNKVLFQKNPVGFDANAEFQAAFPMVTYKTVPFWGAPTLLLSSPLRSYIDLSASTPGRLVPLGQAGPRAILSSKQAKLTAHPGDTVVVPITIANTSNDEFPSGERVFGLSYHLLSSSGQVLQHDNDRFWITSPIKPGEKKVVSIEVRAPDQAATYRIEVDLVWEKVMWFKDIGNPTLLLDLVVS